MKKIKRDLQQQGWHLKSKSLRDGKATLLGGNLRQWSKWALRRAIC